MAASKKAKKRTAKGKAGETAKKKTAPARKAAAKKKIAAKWKPPVTAKAKAKAPKPATAAAAKPAKSAAKAKAKATVTAKAKGKATLAPKPRSRPKAAALAPPANASDLSAAWNDAGRAYFTEYSARIARYYGENDRDVDLDVRDPRSEEMGDQVIRAVIDLNAKGQWQRAREQFDPAYLPLMGWIKQTNRTLGFVTIIGPDELLVRRGSAWQDDGVMFHLRGGTATPVPDVRAVCRSRNRDYLVLARKAGLEVRDARAGVDAFVEPPIATLPWPDLASLRPGGTGDLPPDIAADVARLLEGAELDIEQMQCDDDGTHIVVSCYRQGILLASTDPSEPPWTVLWPSVDARYHDDPRDPPRAGDMTHVAISPDGTRLAFGNQDRGHFLAEIKDGVPSWYATVGHLSEYPHFACFSHDGRYTALNSCHFYNGATIAFDWEGNRGKTLGTYEQHAEAPCIDGSLRVYAGCWLDKPVLDAILGRSAKSPGAFALAGSGVMRLCTPNGAIGFVQGFGSSAGSMDFCPESRRLALASYSGFVHVYDPYEEELPGRIDGWRPRRELTRWIMWEHLPNGPIRW
jgi:hypothetical protein